MIVINFKKIEKKGWSVTGLAKIVMSLTKALHGDDRRFMRENPGVKEFTRIYEIKEVKE